MDIVKENNDFEESEREYLGTVNELIRNLQNQSVTAIDNANLARESLTVDSSDSFGGIDIADRANIASEHGRVTSVLALNNSQLKKIDAVKDKPYFGGVVFTDEFGEKKRLNFGLVAISPLDDPCILEWCSDAASLFYDGGVGHTSYDIHNTSGKVVGKIEGETSDIIHVNIQDGKLVSAVRGDIHLDDEALQMVLRRGKSEKMRSIVGTIQRAQNNIIRDTSNKIVVQGCAGSGKTDVALHKIAYNLRRNKKLKPEDIIIMSPSEALVEYTSDIVPYLTDCDVLNSSFEDVFSSHIKGVTMHSLQEFVSAISSGNLKSKDDEFYRFLYSDKFVEALDKYIERIGKEAEFKDDLTITVRNKKCKYSAFLLNVFRHGARDKKLSEKIDFIVNKICDRPYSQNDSIKNAVVSGLFDTQNKNVIKTLYNNFLNSEEFEEAYGKKSPISNLSSVTYPHAIGMLYLYFNIFGYPKNEYKLCVIDEAQDYSRLQIRMLDKLFEGATVVYVGDVNQSTNKYSRYSSLEEIADLLTDGASYFELNDSYRSTPEIVNYANDILGTSFNPIRESEGREVVERELADEEVVDSIKTDIQTIKDNNNGVCNLTIITSNDKEANDLSVALEDAGVKNKLCDSKNAKDGGIVIIPASQTKGLEFENVMIFRRKADSLFEQNRNLYYLACTRALNSLNVINPVKKKTI